MQEGDGVPKARLEPPQRLGRERDLRHEHDRRPSALQRRCARLEVDLGLAAAGLAVEQEMAAAGIERGGDPCQRRSLLARQLRRLRLVRERLPLAGRCLLLPPLALHGRDQLQRPPGCRPVVVRHPQREVDEHRRQLVEHRVDRNGLDPCRGLVDELDDDSSPPRTAERDRDDRTLRGAVGELVCERPRERAGRHQRIDGRVAQSHHRA